MAVDETKVEVAKATATIRRGASRRVVRWVLSLAAVALVVFTYRDPVRAYFEDAFYREHFLFLWVFFAIAVWQGRRLSSRTTRVSSRGRIGSGIAIYFLGLLLYWVGVASGSSTVQRFSIICIFGAWALLFLGGWSSGRCVGYIAFATLCFGVPYSIYWGLTDIFRRGIAAVLEVTAAASGLGYTIDNLALRRNDFSLEITADCSGFNQLVAFLGLAFLGVLTSPPRIGRTVLLFGMAVVAAFVSNVVRILVFAWLARLGFLVALENQTLHQAIGVAIYSPFLLGFIYVVVRTYRPWPASLESARPRGRQPALILAVPLALVGWAVRGDDSPGEELAYLAGIDQPPGYRLVAHSPTEDRERGVYGTSNLINVSFSSEDESRPPLQIFAYFTTSTRQLNVHQISHCLELPGHKVRYGPKVEVEGRIFCSAELVGPSSIHHVYFAFHVDGTDLDDSFATMVRVFWRRLLGGSRAIGLTRMILGGPLVEPLSANDLELLRWRAAQLRALAAKVGAHAGPPGADATDSQDSPRR